MAKERKNYTFSESTVALLDQVGNASDYLDRIVQERWREWTDAIGLLRGAGWKSEEILVACDALNGYWMVGIGLSPSFLAAELAEAARLRGLCEKHGVAPRLWKSRVEQVRQAPEVAHALAIASQEFWSGNVACGAAIRRG